MTREEFAAAVRTYLGTPYRHQGRTRWGLDCIGLATCALLDCGYVPEDPESFQFSRYRSLADADDLYPRLCREADPVEEGLLSDFYLFKWPQHDFAQHLGIISQPGYFTHATREDGHVVESPLRDQWLDRLVGTMRLKVFVRAGI